MIVWMQVTKDKYELPVAIADSCKELAEIVGKTSNTVSSSITHSKERGNWTPYRKVEITEDDEC